MGTDQQHPPPANVGRPAVVHVGSLDPAAAVRRPGDFDDPALQNEPDLLAAAKRREQAGGKGTLEDYLSAEERAWFEARAKANNRPLGAEVEIRHGLAAIRTGPSKYPDLERDEARPTPRDYRKPEDRAAVTAEAQGHVQRAQERRGPSTPFMEAPLAGERPSQEPPQRVSTEPFDAAAHTVPHKPPPKG
jgi:hypothetical protein